MPARAHNATGIGSSQIPALVGLHAYRDDFGVFNEIVLGVKKTADHMNWGNALEAPVLNYRARQLGAERWRSEERFFLAFGDRHVGGRTVRSRESSIAIASVDDLFTLPGGHVQIEEAKVVGWTEADDWGDTGPDGYEVQVLWQMGVLGLHRGELVATIAQRAPEAFPVEWDATTYGHLLYVAERFWRDHVLTGKPPRGVDGSSAAHDYLRALYPQNTKPLEKASQDVETLVGLYLDADATADAATKKQAMRKQLLCEAIGDREGFELEDGRRVTWRSQKTSSGGTTRVLRISEPKKARRAA